MIIYKFGGSSLSNAANIKKVKEVLHKENNPFLVVVSAFAESTDLLQKIAELALADRHHEALQLFHQKILLQYLKSIAKQSKSIFHFI